MRSRAYRTWRRFARNPLSVLGLVMMTAIVAGALLAPWITPYRHHASAVVDVASASKLPRCRSDRLLELRIFWNL